MQLNEHLNLSPYFVDNSETSGFNWEKFQGRIDMLPEAVFGLMLDEETSEFIKSLTRKYAIPAQGGSSLARVIRDVIIGDLFIGDMPAKIAKRTGLDPATAREVANLIVSQLFAPALDDIKKIQAEKFPGRLPAKPAPATETPLPPVASQPPQPKYPGQDLPETGGNIIDLRNK